jgi:hypothetical protein
MIQISFIDRMREYPLPRQHLRSLLPRFSSGATIGELQHRGIIDEYPRILGEMAGGQASEAPSKSPVNRDQSLAHGSGGGQ